MHTRHAEVVRYKSDETSFIDVAVVNRYGEDTMRNLKSEIGFMEVQAKTIDCHAYREPNEEIAVFATPQERTYYDRSEYQQPQT